MACIKAWVAHLATKDAKHIHATVSWTLSLHESLSLATLDQLSSNLRASQSSPTNSVQHIGGPPLLALLGGQLCRILLSD